MLVPKEIGAAIFSNAGNAIGDYNSFEEAIADAKTFEYVTDEDQVFILEYVVQPEDDSEDEVYRRSATVGLENGQVKVQIKDHQE